MLVGWLHLAAPLIVTLFAYLALARLDFLKHRGKWAAVGMFLFLLLALASTLGHFLDHVAHALPIIAEEAVPLIIQWAKQHAIELPFSDYDSLKELVMDTVKSQVHYLADIARFARGAGTQAVLALAGCAVAIGLFLHPKFALDPVGPPARDSLYSACCVEIERRFLTLYRSFVTVMGAQVVIATINAGLTAVFVAAFRLPHPVVVVGVTLLCGLLPVVGNLVSNTIVVGVSFTVSPRMALVGLVYLVLIHKLEYLLNSKIVGWRIRNPFWLTLVALIVGERLLGVPGIILAPVVLNYIKLETSAVPAP